MTSRSSPPLVRSLVPSSRFRPRPLRVAALATSFMVPWLAGTAADAGVVHLRDGDSFVGTIAFDAAGAVRSVATAYGDVAIDTAQVLLVEEDARLEASLADALARANRAPLAERPGECLRVADWAARKGLFERAFDLADRALRDAKRARRDETCAPRSAEPPLPGVVDGGLPAVPASLFDLPVAGIRGGDPIDAERAWTLLSHAASRRPARAQVAAARLEQAATRTDVTPVVLRGLADGDPGVRTAALRVLGRTTPAGTIEKVIERMLFDRSAEVRLAAARAVEAYRNDGVIFPLVRALQQDDPALRAAAMDAIEFLRDERAMAMLIANLRRAPGSGVRNHVAVTTQTSIVRDFDVEIAQAAVIAQPVVDVVTHGAVLDVSVVGAFARGIEPAERARIARVLAWLSGEDFGTNAAAWEAWLQTPRK